jgi:hypothetical protein
MRHRRLVACGVVGWLVAVAAAVLAVAQSDLVWLVPIAALATITLPLRATRTLSWALPVATVAGLESSADPSRIALALVTVVAAIVVVGALDAWDDSAPARAAAAVLDPAGRSDWRAARRPALVRSLGLLVAFAAGWTALTAVTWSSGWLVAMLPAAATVAVAATTWPLWRPTSR